MRSGARRARSLQPSGYNRSKLPTGAFAIMLGGVEIGKKPNDTASYVLAAWITPLPKLRIMAVEKRTSPYDGIEAGLRTFATSSIWVTEERGLLSMFWAWTARICVWWSIEMAQTSKTCMCFNPSARVNDYVKLFCVRSGPAQIPVLLIRSSQPPFNAKIFTVWIYKRSRHSLVRGRGTVVSSLSMHTRPRTLYRRGRNASRSQKRRDGQHIVRGQVGHDGFMRLVHVPERVPC